MIKKIKVEVSNKHVHLCREHVDVLFGCDYELNVHKELSQPGQFACVEKVALIKNGRRIDNVRVLGPCRDRTQVEVSRTDSIYLRLDAPLKLSGDSDGSVGIVVVGPRGRVELVDGVMISHRHLHVSDSEALELGVKHGDIVSLRVPGLKEIIFGNVIVRVGPEHRLALHIDCDEGNACFVGGCGGNGVGGGVEGGGEGEGDGGIVEEEVFAELV